jgi:hypothetical protein
VFSKWGGGVSKSLCEDLPIEVQKKKSRGRFENYFEKVIASDKLTAALQRIISIFESNNIELIGVKFPLSEVYFEILRNKKGQAVIFALGKVFMFVVFGVFLFYVFPTFRDLAFASTESLWIRIPVSLFPAFYIVGILFYFVRAIRQGVA